MLRLQTQNTTVEITHPGKKTAIKLSFLDNLEGGWDSLDE